MTTFSGVIRNYNVHYDNEIQNCQLYLWVFANSGQGKGSIEKFKRIGLKFHSELLKQYKNLLSQYEVEESEWEKNGKTGTKPQKPVRQAFFLAGNSTKSALLKSMSENGGYGCIFETEADTLTTANKGEHGGLIEALRQAFHSEGLMINRIGLDEPIEIKKLVLSVILSSTIDQCFGLMPTYDNGLMSRFMYFQLPNDLKFRDVFKSRSTNDINVQINKLADVFCEIGFENLKEHTKLFEFTMEQEKRHFEYFNFLNDLTVVQANKSYLKSNINRLGLIFTRICMLLSYIRIFEKSSQFKKLKIEEVEEIKCSDLDFDIAISITEKLYFNLLKVDSLYHILSPQKPNKYFIPDSVNTIENNVQKKEALELHKKGLSYAEIAKQVLGDIRKKGTIHKWIKKYISFPFPETETGGKIDVIKRLKEAEVDYYEEMVPPLYKGCINLFDLLTTDIFKSEVQKVRLARNEEQKKKLKRSTPCFTASGLFLGERNKENLKKHSGFICIDIDKKDNEHIENFKELKQQLKKIINVVFVSHSVSGEGFFVLFPIEDTEKHENYFEALNNAFKTLEPVHNLFLS